MSANGETPLVAYAVSTAVGSGKTSLAIEYMASKDDTRQNFIYVAPTIKLLNQTAEDLRVFIDTTSSDREVVLIHTDSKRMEHVPVSEEAKLTINGAEVGSGLVVIITTATFLRIMCGIHAARDWRVIIDEGFSPVTFLKVHLGLRANEGFDHFLKNFSIQPETYLVEAASGQANWVQELAAGIVRRSGEQNLTTKELAAAVSNPGIVCELVMSDKVRLIMDRVYVPPAADAHDPSSVESESILTIACYVSPSALLRFGEVTFMSALFEETMLFQMWTTMFGVAFIEHPAFPKSGLRDIHVDQGPRVAIGHLLHEDDRTSMFNLEKNFETGAEYERVAGLRVIDHLVGICANFFADCEFLLQTNDAYGYVNGSSTMPLNAVKVPTLSHGLNEFQGYDNVAALAVTNPIPQETEWIVGKTGLSKDQIMMAFRIHTTYQAIGRSSIRRAKPTSAIKTFLTVGRADADLLHAIFEGSKWLGQIGDMKSLSSPHAASFVDSIEWKTSKLIRDYLDSLTEDVTKMSSRSVRLALDATTSVSDTTWTRSVRTASEYSDGWAAVRQSFVRKDGAFYGFSVVEGGYHGSSPDIETETVCANVVTRA